RVEESADLSIVPANEDERIAAEFMRKIVARMGDAVGVAGEEPVSPEDPLQIEGEDLRIGVERLLQRPAGPVPGDQISDPRFEMRDIGFQHSPPPCPGGIRTRTSRRLSEAPEESIGPTRGCDRRSGASPSQPRRAPRPVSLLQAAGSRDRSRGGACGP